MSNCVLKDALRNARIKLAWAALVVIGVPGCVQVPTADPITSGPSFDLVVRRVKCDLAEVLWPYLEDERYAWLQTWVAQASLTAIANNASTLTPGATFTQPLTVASVPLRVTNFGRSASLGLGAGFNSTASRNETVTFSISLRELKDEHHDPAFCNYPDLTDIHSELGLQEWIYAALSPAGWGDLVPGHHKTTKAGGTGATTTSASTPSATASPAGVLSTTVYQAALTAAVSNAIREARPPAPPQPGQPPIRRPPRDRILDLKRDIDEILKQIQRDEIDDPITIVNTAVTGVTPDHGSMEGETHILIIGANFNSLYNDDGKLKEGVVRIGGVPAKIVKVPNDSTICATTPRYFTPGKVDVVVNGSGGAGTRTQAFMYNDPKVQQEEPGISVAPDSSPIKANEEIRITGPQDKTKGTWLDITQATSVSFADKPGVITTRLKEMNTINVSAPTIDDAQNLPVTVTLPNKTLSTTINFFDPSCPPQSTSKKKIIAYVDQRLGKAVYKALFKTGQLIEVVERRLERGGNQKELNQVLQATKALQDALLALQLDPPVDTIGHQVQFIVVENASISPSWTLVHFKGPSPSSGSGASVTKTRTHTLNIVVGPPGSPDVANTLGALQLGTQIGNSLSVTGAAVSLPP